MDERAHMPVNEAAPSANEGSSSVTDPGKKYSPPDTQVGGGSPGGIEQVDATGMVRCRSCGMLTPGVTGSRCVRCNTPVRSGR